MAAIKETIITKSGLMMVRKIFARKRLPGEKRLSRMEPTIEAVEKLNQRNSLREMTVKVHNNFGPGDHWLTITYEGKEPTKEEAKKAIKKYIDHIRRKRKSAGKEFKWILITEYQNKRIHHHMLVNNADDFRDLIELWPNGLVRDTPLDSTGDYRKLCEYMHKETSKTFRDPDAPSRLRYTCSRNLIMPAVYREEISAAEVYEEPAPEKGYYIDPESVYQGENPFDGRPYVEYVMLPVDKPRTRYNKKTKSKFKSETHFRWLRNHIDRQTEMDYPF